jgi:hypothetical protein
MAKSKSNKTAKKQTPKKKLSVKFNKIDFKSDTGKKILKVVGMIFLVIATFSLIDLFVQYLNNDYSIAVVNGARVPKSQYVKKLESTYGTSVALQLIEEEIIKQEAKEADIKISQDEINIQIEDIKSRIGGDEAFEQALEANNLSLKDLEDNIRINLQLQKIIEPTLEYTDDDIKVFFDQYSDVLFPDQIGALEEGEKLDFEEYKDKTRELYIQQEVGNMSDSWIAEKKNDYRIQDNASEKPKYGFLTTSVNIVKNLLDQANSNE